jgi:hypothetical protein
MGSVSLDALYIEANRRMEIRLTVKTIWTLPQTRQAISALLWQHVETAVSKVRRNSRIGPTTDLRTGHFSENLLFFDSSSCRQEL